MTDIDRITGDVLDAAIRLHKELGAGRLVNDYRPSASLRLCANQITE